MSLNPPNLVRAYLVAAVACVVTGWGLSRLHWLSLPGYLVVLPLVILALAWLLRRSGSAAKPARLKQLYVLSRRFRRPLPLVFLVASLLTLVGGALYAPTNYDALTYRLPRMLNWLAHDGWTWIATYNDRMNYSGTGWEWFALPLLIFHSDRSLFLINVGGFLLMPGLLFSIFRQVGIARRAAWMWMWILPLAYGYAMQAGSVGNDLTGTIFCLMAVHFGLRARRNGRVEDVWLAGLAAACLTGIKTSNLPLLLPCLVAVWPALTCLRQRWLAGIAIVGIGILVSAGPLAMLNQKYAGSWTGDPQNRGQLQATSAGGALLGNGLLLAQQSFMPPVLPGAHQVNIWFNEHLPASWQKELSEKFPRYALAQLNELPQEEGSGLGLGVTGLLLISLAAGIIWLIRRGNPLPRATAWATWTIGLAAWVAALVYGCKLGSEATARLLLPYYPLLIIPLLSLPGQDWLVRRRSWRILAVLAAVSILPGLVLTPAHPLWPAQTVSKKLVQTNPENKMWQRLATTYDTYARRNDLLAPLRASLPDAATTIGLVAGSNDAEYSLWRPFGQRRVICLRDGDGKLVSLPPDLEWLVVKCLVWPEVSNLSLEDWAAQHHAEIVSSAAIVSLASAGAETWCVLHVRNP